MLSPIQTLIGKRRNKMAITVVVVIVVVVIVVVVVVVVVERQTFSWSTCGCLCSSDPIGPVYITPSTCASKIGYQEWSRMFSKIKLFNR